MTYLPEMLILGAFLLALIIYLINNATKDTEKKRTLLLRFRDVRARSLHLQNAVADYIMANDSEDGKITTDMTYGQFLKQLKKNHIANLSEKKFAKIKNSNTLLSQRSISSMIDEQNSMVGEMEKQFETAKNNPHKLQGHTF